jgi:uncharacterized protein
MKNVQNDVHSETIQLRAHHVLCLQGFQGYGYSETFTEYMSQLKKKFLKNPSIFLEIVNSPDSICKHCPYYSNGKCNIDSYSENRIRAMDDLILEILKMEDGSIIIWEDIKFLTSKLTKEEVEHICESCSWMDKCLYFQEMTLK